MEFPKCSGRGCLLLLMRCLGKHLRLGASCLWNQPCDWNFQYPTSLPPPTHSLSLQRGEGGWRLNQSPVTSDLISPTYVIEACGKTQEDGIWRISGLANTWRCRESCKPGEGMDTLHSFPYTLPYASLPSAVPKSCPFTTNH